LKPRVSATLQKIALAESLDKNKVKIKTRFALLLSSHKRLTFFGSSYNSFTSKHTSAPPISATKPIKTSHTKLIPSTLTNTRLYPWTTHYFLEALLALPGIP
jgi:hypothetical protein